MYRCQTASRSCSQRTDNNLKVQHAAVAETLELLLDTGEQVDRRRSQRPQRLILPGLLGSNDFHHQLAVNLYGPIFLGSRGIFEGTGFHAAVFTVQHQHELVA